MLRFVIFWFWVLITVSNGDQVDDWIVGGEEVDISRVPYMAAIRRFGRHHCGAAILNAKFALTAAHCFYRFQDARYTLNTGSSHVYNGGVTYELARFIIHENYDPLLLINDVTMVEVEGVITFNENTLPVSLPNSNFILKPGDAAIVTGWGYTKEDGSLSSQLMAVNVSIIDRDECNKVYEQRRKIADSMLCAGFWEGNKDSCQGDSGGPLVSRDVIVGVVSWGRGCARPGFPGVYANVSHLINWISEKMGTVSTYESDVSAYGFK